MEKFLRTKTGVNFRKGPGTNFGIIKTLSQGTIVQALNYIDGTTWTSAKLEDGTFGYITILDNFVEEYVPEWLSTIKKIIDYVEDKKYLGTPYVFGSTRTNDISFDCSDFVQWVYKNAAGIILPWDSRQQSEEGKEISASELRTGDLIFFDPDKDGYITHVAIYIYENKILHTASKTQIVRDKDLVPTGQIGGVTYYPYVDNYYTRGAVKYRRVIL